MEQKIDRERFRRDVLPDCAVYEVYCKEIAQHWNEDILDAVIRPEEIKARNHYIAQGGYNRGSWIFDENTFRPITLDAMAIYYFEKSPKDSDSCRILEEKEQTGEEYLITIGTSRA